MRLVVACMARNEANKFWESALDAWSYFADEAIILDDGSTDETAEIAEEYGAHVMHRTADAAWGEEAPARAALWNAATHVTKPGDWIFILDADMVPANNPKDILHDAADAVAFRLFDLWGYDRHGHLLYRNDGFWRGHVHPRVWCVRHPEEKPDEWLWPDRGIHTGHFPTNLHLERVLYAPLDYSLLHYAYVNQDLRRAKAEQYESVAAQLTVQEQQHALSILHPRPTLNRLPFPTEYTLTLGDDSDG